MEAGGDTKTPETHGPSSLRRDVLVKMTVKLGAAAAAAAPWHVELLRTSSRHWMKHLRWQEEQDSGYGRNNCKQQTLKMWAELRFLLTL